MPALLMSSKCLLMQGLLATVVVFAYVVTRQLTEQMSLQLCMHGASIRSAILLKHVYIHHVHTPICIHKELTGAVR